MYNNQNWVKSPLCTSLLKYWFGPGNFKTALESPGRTWIHILETFLWPLVGNFDIFCQKLETIQQEVTLSNGASSTLTGCLSDKTKHKNLFEYTAFPLRVKEERSEYLIKSEPKQINNTGQELWTPFVGDETTSRRQEVCMKVENVSHLIESKASK